MPTVPSSKRFPGSPESDGLDEPGGYAAKIKIRYLVEKRIDNAWVVMARLSSETDRMLELCEALGGKIRVQDIETSALVIDQEFE
jgi:hypothetical protein